MSIRFWMPLLFFAIAIFHGMAAWQEFRRSGKTDTPVFKAKIRIAGIFFVVTLFLAFYLQQ